MYKTTEMKENMEVVQPFKRMKLSTPAAREVSSGYYYHTKV